MDDAKASDPETALGHRQLIASRPGQSNGLEDPAEKAFIMIFRKQSLALLSLALMASPATAWAFGGGAGCSDLPEYYRAVGALQGMTGACDMSVEQAQRIVAQQGPQPAGGTFAGAAVSNVDPAGPVPHARHRRHRVRPLQP